MNIFIEGIPGSGKSTLMRLLAQKKAGYLTYWEGELSPVELKWCSYMSEESYQKTLELFPHLQDEIRKNTRKEEGFCMVSYTHILAEDREFYKYMEQYEIYNGNCELQKFQDIILRRMKAFRGNYNLFESSFFQNIIVELMLFQLCSGEEILDFYKQLFSCVEQDKFRMIYLESEDILQDLETIRKERTDMEGNEIWYELILRYLNASPYGKEHPFEEMEDMADFFRWRIRLEKKIIREVLKERCVVIPAKNYEINSLIRKL